MFYMYYVGIKIILYEVESVIVPILLWKTDK